MKGHRKAEHMKENVFDSTSKNLRELAKEIEKLDEEYYGK